MSNQVERLFSKAASWVWKNTWNTGAKIAEDWGEFKEARAGISGAANKWNQRGYAVGKFMDTGIGIGTHSATTAAKVMGLGLVGGLTGIGLTGLGIAGLVGFGAVKLAGAVARHALPAAPRSALNLGGVALGAAAKTFGGAEIVARTVLTGGLRGVEGPLDAWLPNFRNMSGDKLAKYALNPRIATRVAIGAFGVGLASAAWNVMNPKAPPASAYFDGVHMRRIGDMGATAGYGNRVMNSAPNFSNLDYRTASQSLVHLL